MRAEDLTGMTFGFLTALEQVKSRPRPGRRRDAVWRCICTCGQQKLALAAHLKAMQCKSCGCGQYKLTSEQRQTLLTVYLRDGYHATRPMAEAYGIAPRYLAKMARRYGHTDNHQGKHAAKIPRPKFTDPRWQRAIANGSITA